MSKESDLNFVPAVHCPHCKELAHVSISGWGGELSTRSKVCRYCGKEYRVLIFTFTDKEIESTTAAINGKKKRIEYLKQRIREKLEKVTNKTAEWAEEFLRIEASTGGKQN